VLLATVAGRTSTEIGAIEGIPVPTAKTRLRTGLRRLRELTSAVPGEGSAARGDSTEAGR
jgi:RNA polymerase sigma-70 factor (ECF subfamily)